MRCRQLLSLSVTLATLLVLVKCEPDGNTPVEPAKASGNQQDTNTANGDQQKAKDTIKHQATNVDTNATTNETGKTPTSQPETVNNFTTTAPNEDVNITSTIRYGTPTASQGNETNTSPKGNETTATTIKQPVNCTTTTPKPHHSTSSALTALSAVTLCVLSLTVSL